MAARSQPAAWRTDPLYGAPVIGPSESVASIGDALAGAVLAPAGRGWRLASAGALALILASAGLRWALPAPALSGAGGGWWIGLASGGLMLAGLLLLAGVEWRCGIGRLAQTAALLGAIIAAGQPASIQSVGRAALLATSLALWAVALLPDLAVLRDRLAVSGGAGSGLARLYRAAGAGWRGSALQWLVWERVCRGLALLGILAAVAALMDLALASVLRSGRHETLRPVMLLVEAVLAGAGMTAALAVALRRFRGLDGLVTGRHLDILGRLILAFGLAAIYCHVTALATPLLHGDAAEREQAARLLLGDEAPAFWTLMLAGLLPTQLFWIGSARRRAAAVGLIGALVAIGLRADYGPIVPDAMGAGGLAAVLTAAAGFLGPLGLFALGLLLLFRRVPPVSIAETRQLALARNPGAALRAPPGGPGSGSALVAVFTSEACLAEAARGLAVLDRAPGLDAFGPVPLPEAAVALHRSERSVSRLALAGAILGADAFLLAGAAALAGAAPDGWAGITVLDWAMLAVPAVSAAALGGTLGLVTALALVLRGPRRGALPPTADPPARLAEHFVLMVETDAERLDPAVLAHRLRALPQEAGRPLTLYGPAGPGLRR